MRVWKVKRRAERQLRQENGPHHFGNMQPCTQKVLQQNALHMVGSNPRLFQQMEALGATETVYLPTGSDCVREIMENFGWFRVRFFRSHFEGVD
jgi:tartrate dehydratase beta subunit/fumarate hydratase class I family protein